MFARGSDSGRVNANGPFRKYNSWLTNSERDDESSSVSHGMSLWCIVIHKLAIRKMYGCNNDSIFLEGNTRAWSKQMHNMKNYNIMTPLKTAFLKKRKAVLLKLLFFTLVLRCLM